MLRSATLPVLGVACLLACTSAAEPRVIPTVEVEKPRVDAPPTAVAVRPRDEIPAPAAAVEPMEAWSIVKLNRERSDFPWVRAIHALKGHLELPRSSMSEPMTMAPVVVITPEGVYFAGRRVAKIEYGVILDLDIRKGVIAALKDPLHQALEANAAEEGRLPGPRVLWTVALFADAGTPFRVLIDVMFTGGQAGATSYLIAVDRPGEPMMQGSDVLQMAPATRIRGQTASEIAASEQQKKLEMVMELSPTDVRIGRHVPHDPARSAWLERVSLEGDRYAAMRRITELAQAMIAEEQWGMFDMPTVRFSADEYVPLETLIAALAAAAGPDCKVLEFGAEARSRCLFLNRDVYPVSAAPPELAGR